LIQGSRSTPHCRWRWWSGWIFSFLWRLDRQARELRRLLDQRPRAEAPAPQATLETRNGQPRASAVTTEE